jgi:hypothetical protein
MTIGRPRKIEHYEKRFGLVAIKKGMFVPSVLKIRLKS